jgi:DivIVA domain-containing protein
MARMELSPQAVAAATFKTVKRGYDPDEVRSYLIEVSASLEASHQQATAMEARARAAIAKLQDATQNAQHTGPVPVVAPAPAAVPTVGPDEAETISRTLLLAQRTADTTVAEAKARATSITETAQAEAAGVTAAARLEAASTLEQARAEAARLLDEARTEAHRAKTDQQLRAESEVKELQSRREALIADLDTLEQHAARHRDQLRETSTAIDKLADQMPAEIERPALSAPVGPSSPSSPSSPLLLNGDDTGGHRIPPPPITGQVPLQPGVEPLVSPRPTSADEVRSMWQEAERAELAGQGLIDSTPVDGIGFDAPTPTDGIRR